MAVTSMDDAPAVPDCLLVDRGDEISAGVERGGEPHRAAGQLDTARMPANDDGTANTVTDQRPKTLGLKWKEAGSETPPRGTEIKNKAFTNLNVHAPDEYIHMNIINTHVVLNNMHPYPHPPPQPSHTCKASRRWSLALQSVQNLLHIISKLRAFPYLASSYEHSRV